MPVLYLYRCTECGKLSPSLGKLHGGHCEKHLGWGPWNMLPPPFPGDFDALMEITEVIHVSDYDVVDLGDVPENLVEAEAFSLGEVGGKEGRQ